MFFLGHSVEFTQHCVQSLTRRLPVRTWSL